MSLYYGNKWDNQFRNHQGSSNPLATQLWMEALFKRGITAMTLRKVVHKTLDQHSDFAPRLPEVIAMCKEIMEEELGLPDLYQAYAQVTTVRGRFNGRKDGYWRWAKQTHLAVYHALQAMDTFRFDRLPHKEALKMFEAAWNSVKQRLLKGEKLDPVPYVLKDDSNETPKPSLNGSNYAAFRKWCEEHKMPLGTPLPS